MLFIDGPSQFAPVSTWQVYLKHLKTLNQGDRSVVQETARARRIITILMSDRSYDGALPPD